MSDMQEGINQAYALVLTLWTKAINNVENPDERHNLALLLGKAALLLRDAGLVAVNPRLKQVECIVIASGIHALYNGGVYRTVCGAEPEAGEWIEPRTCVPTCEACVKILTEQDK